MTRGTEVLANHPSASESQLVDTATPVEGRSLRTIVAALFPPHVVLFVGFFAWYLYAVVDLRLVFQARDKLFLWNLGYFTDFVGKPGSLLEWVDNLLVQLCYSGWPAALALAAAAWVLLVSTIGLMNALGRADRGGTWAIPAVLLTVLVSNYHFRALAIVALALAIAAANGWCRMPGWRPWLRLTVFVSVSAALYYVAGAAWYVFAACCLVQEALVAKRRLAGIFLLLAAVGVKFGLDAVLARLNLATEHFYVRWHVPSEEDAVARLYRWVMLLYAYFPACALFMVSRQTVCALTKTLWTQLQRSTGKDEPPRPDDGNRQEQAAPLESSAPRTGIWGWLYGAVGPVLVLLLAALAGSYALDRERKASLEIDYCVEHHLWNDVLVKARNLRLKAYSQYVNHDVFRALYHTGRLPDQMFAYPQRYWPLLTLNQLSNDLVRSKDYGLIRKPCDLLLELGRVNEAEHLAIELQEMQPSGTAFQRLALVEMTRGQSAAAKVYLNVLRDDLLWGRWAEGYLKLLARDPDLVGDDEIQRMRGLLIVIDDLPLSNTLLPNGGHEVDSTIYLRKLLEQNSRNRMAFEYLMAIWLGSGNLSAAIDSLSLVDNFSYPAVPPLYEQAALIYGIQHPKELKTTSSGISFRGRRISKPTMDKFRRFQAIVEPFGGPNEKTKTAVARELGDSYFYYYFYVLGKKS